MNDLMLSIYVPTFMHEKYIAQTLDSILMQKTQYSYELLIGDDASTDKTPDIIKSYEQRYPNIIKAFYREKNMYKQVPNNSDDLLLRCKGKYIICIEGDDFWTDPLKIEKQITFLENNPEYLAVAHNCIMVDDNSNLLPNHHYIDCHDTNYSIEHFFSKTYPGQTATFMIRNFITNNLFDTSLIFKGHGARDAKLFFSAICNGKIYCMQEVMSAYRKSLSPFAFTNTYKFNYETEKAIKLDFLNYAYKINNEKAIKLTKVQYIDNVFRGLRKKYINISTFLNDLKIIDNKQEIFYLLLKQKINRYILRKSLYF